MSNPSQDSISRQLSKLQQEATVAEQKAAHKNAEVLAGQRKLADLDRLIRQKTKQLIAEQSTILEEAIADLQVELAKSRHNLSELQIRVKDIKKEHSIVVEKVAELQLQHTELADSLTKSRKSIVDDQKQLQIIKKEIPELENVKSDLEKTNSSLFSEELRLEDVIKEKKTVITELRRQIAMVTTELAEQKADKEKKLGLLNAKLLAVTTQIKQYIEEDMMIRRSLANWQKQLEERDQNLRIREAKVEQGEDKIVRNANLMNL